MTLPPLSPPSLFLFSCFQPINDTHTALSIILMAPSCTFARISRGYEREKREGEREVWDFYVMDPSWKSCRSYVWLRSILEIFHIIGWDFFVKIYYTKFVLILLKNIYLLIQYEIFKFEAMAIFIFIHGID